MSQILATGFMIFSLQELLEAYSDHPGIMGLSIENAQGNFVSWISEYENENSTNRSSYNPISICIPT